MPLNIPQINYANTYGHFISMVNQMANAVSTIVVTTNGIPTVGDAVVHGKFTANTLAAETVTAMTVGGNLAVASANVTFQPTSRLTISTSNTTITSQTTLTSPSLLKFATPRANTAFRYLAVDANNATYYETAERRLSDLLDAAVAAPTQGQYLVYNETLQKWQNQTFGGSFDALTVNGPLSANNWAGPFNVTGNANSNVNNVLYVIPHPSDANRRRVGIKVADPQGTLHVDGNGYFTGDVDFKYTSDARFKNLTELAPGIEGVRKLSGWKFLWNDLANTDYTGNKVGKLDVGVIAQDVEKVLPEAVEARVDGTLSVDYHKLIPVLINAIKDLDAKVAALEVQVNGNAH